MRQKSRKRKHGRDMLLCGMVDVSPEKLEDVRAMEEYCFYFRPPSPQTPAANLPENFEMMVVPSGTGKDEPISTQG